MRPPAVGVLRGKARGPLTRRLVLLLAVLGAGALAAQEVPRRPRLGGDADTNDAAAYFRWGLERFASDPGRAAAAFYWASRLDPLAPQSLYALYASRLKADPRLLVPYLRRDPRTLASAEVRALDSLLLRAEMHDPFLHRGMDEPLLIAYAQASRSRDEFSGTSQSGGRSGMTWNAEQYFESADPYMRGRMAYSRERYADALRFMGDALRDSHTDWLYAERGRTWMEAGRPDSAIPQYREAIRLAAAAAAGGEPRYLFENPAAWETALARALSARREAALARAACERAIALDSTYVAARVLLATLALAARDTAAALAQLERVWRAPEADFAQLVIAAASLSRAGRRDEAARWLHRAVEREPLSAGGWFRYASALDAIRSDEATAAWERFVALAARDDVERESAVRRLSATRP